MRGRQRVVRPLEVDGPAEPPPTPWEFPDPESVDGDLVAVGADLEPGTILAAYRHGLFPMPVDKRNLGWWSPSPRAIPRGVTTSRVP